MGERERVEVSERIGIKQEDKIPKNLKSERENAFEFRKCKKKTFLWNSKILFSLPFFIFKHKRTVSKAEVQYSKTGN